MERLSPNRKAVVRVVSPLLLIALAATCALGQTADRADSLAARIEELRLEASYAEAAETAEQLLGLQRSDPAAAAFEVGDAERLLEVLLAIASLPEEQRRQMAAADSLHRSLWQLWGEGRRDEAVAAGERRLEVCRRLLGEAHVVVASCMVDLGDVLASQGRLEEAEAYFGSALELRRIELGEDHPDVASTLVSRGWVAKWSGDHEQAESLFREGLATYRRLFGDEHPDVANTLRALGLVAGERGDYEEAAELCRDVLAIRRRVLGPDHELVASSVNGLAATLVQLGDTEGAEPLAREALAMSRRRLGGEHPEVARHMVTLGVVLQIKGDYESAERLFRQALDIARTTPVLDRPSVAYYSSSLAALLLAKGDYEGAEQLYREALELNREFYGADHGRIAWILTSIGDVLWKKGDPQGSREYLTEALAMYRRCFGDVHHMAGMCLHHLARVQRWEGDYATAESTCREALSIYRRQLGNEHPRVSNMLRVLAGVVWAQGDLGGAEALLAQAAGVHDAARLRAGSGLVRSIIAGSPYRELAAARLRLGNKDEAWPAAEKSLALALADLLRAADERVLTTVESAREDSLRRVLTDLESQLAGLAGAAEGDDAGEARVKAEEVRGRLLAAEAAWSALQRELAGKHPVTEGQPFDLDRVQASLHEDAAIIGWLDVDVEGEQHSWCYAIRDSGPVAWARAGSDSESPHGHPSADRTLSFRRGLSDPSAGLIGIAQEARGLWADRIEPLGPVLDGVTRIVALPSGPMLGVPIESLVDREGVSVGERYAMSYAPSATLYAWLSERRTSNPGARMLLVGDPPFNEEQLVAMESGQPVAVSSLSDEHMSPALVRGALAGNADALSSLPRLSGTRAEVEAIEQLSGNASVLLGADASEEQLARLAESGQLGEYRTIHIATHALVDDGNPERSAAVLSQVDLSDALESALAGHRVYDGLLSAREIVREWRLEADLVTLSACQTGLGKIVGGEGYVGLAHAFLQAGARSLLVSLWKVEDTATSLLMLRFYENWLGEYDDERGGHRGEPMSKAEALQEAKQWLRNYTDEYGRRPYEHPYYWSAFTLIGDSS